MTLSTQPLRYAIGQAQDRFKPPHERWRWMHRRPFPFNWGPNGPLWWLVICLLPAILLMVSIAVASAETCVASHYGSRDGYGGKRTASGERMNPGAMTAAHRSLPFGSLVRVCYRGCVTVRINDRGPFVRGRCIDLSSGAARAIGMGGLARVTINR